MTIAGQRCGWCGSDELYQHYHDTEWGVPCRDERKLFEFLILEGAQAGLSWITVLRRREGYRAAFDQFDPEKVARYDEKKCLALKEDPGIIRNRLKIDSAVRNARAYLEVQERHGSFGDFIWQFVDGEPKQNQWRSLAELPATSAESDAMSKALKKAGFNFVGSTICYAYMQAMGMVNDHLSSCFRHTECAALTLK